MLKFRKRNLVYFFLILVVLLTSLLSPYLRKTTLNLLNYPLGILTLIKREIKGIIFYHRHLVENEELKKEVGRLKEILNRLQEIYEENKRLKRLLDFKEKSSFKLVACKIIGYAPDNWSSVVIINKGRKNGIKEDMVVITPLGLVGRIIQSDASFSKVMLINDPDFRVSCRIQRSRQEGLVSGTLGNNLIMRYLPWEADVKVSDVIITSGLTGLYPKGIVVGKVIEVGSDFVGLSKYAVIQPAVDIKKLEEVLVIIE